MNLNTRGYLYSLNNAKFDQLILSKIAKIVAARCHIKDKYASNLISAGDEETG